jgi:hypothetical protein
MAGLEWIESYRVNHRQNKWDVVVAVARHVLTSSYTRLRKIELQGSNIMSAKGDEEFVRSHGLEL